MTEISVWHTGRTAGWSMWQWFTAKKKLFSVYEWLYTGQFQQGYWQVYACRTKLIKLPPTCPLHLSFLMSTHIPQPYYNHLNIKQSSLLFFVTLRVHHMHAMVANKGLEKARATRSPGTDGLVHHALISTKQTYIWNPVQKGSFKLTPQPYNTFTWLTFLHMSTSQTYSKNPGTQPAWNFDSLEMIQNYVATTKMHVFTSLGGIQAVMIPELQQRVYIGP